MRGTTTRRRFFAWMGTAPIAARQGMETAARQLAGIGNGQGVPSLDLRGSLIDGANDVGAPSSAQMVGADWRLARKLRDDLIRKALDTPERRAELEAILYEEHRSVHNLDPDLAANRSFSLAAKVCYQRQRNVQRAIEYTVKENSPWEQVRSWKDRVLSLAGIKF